MLHLVGIIVRQWIGPFDADLQLVIDQTEAIADVASPMVHNAPAQDARQPGSLATTDVEQLAAFPGRAEGVLQEVLRLVPVADHAEGHPVKRRTVLRDPTIKIALCQSQGHRSRCVVALASGDDARAGLAAEFARIPTPERLGRPNSGESGNRRISDPAPRAWHLKLIRTLFAVYSRVHCSTVELRPIARGRA